MKIGVKRSRAFTNNLLKALVIGGIVVVTASNPFFGVKAIGAISKELKRRKWKHFKDHLHYLKYRGFIEVEQNPDGSYTVKTTASGRRQAAKYELDDISVKVKVPKKWDRQWRLVIFDIPADKQKGRLAFLSKLKQLGFIMLQKKCLGSSF